MSRALGLFVLGSFFVVAAVQRSAPAHPSSSTADYQERNIQGFHVFVNKELLAHKDETDAVLGELNSQLEKVVQVVPTKPLSILHKVRFWVERAAVPNKASVFRVSAEALRQRGDNPDKAGGVEISNAQKFVEWSHKFQPWAAFHELAHAYHFHVLGYNNPTVQTTYRQAIEHHLYGKVKYVGGAEKEAYAAENPQEYFAELSEAYFGKNDFYPFTNDELKSYDPSGYRLMQQAWGRPRTAAEPAKGKTRSRKKP